MDGCRELRSSLTNPAACSPDVDDGFESSSSRLDLSRFARFHVSFSPQLPAPARSAPVTLIVASRGRDSRLAGWLAGWLACRSWSFNGADLESSADSQGKLAKNGGAAIAQTCCSCC